MSSATIGSLLSEHHSVRNSNSDSVPIAVPSTARTIQRLHKQLVYKIEEEGGQTLALIRTDFVRHAKNLFRSLARVRYIFSWVSPAPLRGRGRLGTKNNVSNILTIKVTPGTNRPGELRDLIKAPRACQRVGHRHEAHFVSLEEVRNFLTRERMALLRTIKGRHPGSIYELAKTVKRSLKSVQTDPKVLEGRGLVPLSARQQEASSARSSLWRDRPPDRYLNDNATDQVQHTPETQGV
ncbi:MAG: hypothetical protein ACHQZS_12015 [Candidatus Binatales bacterium]